MRSCECVYLGEGEVLRCQSCADQAELAALRKQVAQLEAAIRRALGPQGCACIRDLPGESYTCTACAFLAEVAARDETPKSPADQE